MEVETGSKDNGEEEDIPCAVCLDGSVYDNNEIIFCDKCNVPVHQSCYGVEVVPEGSWYCSACAAGKDPSTLACELCSNTGGAYKPTEKQGKWVHSMCALWVPEIYLAKVKDVTVYSLERLDKKRFKLRCGLCTSKGAAIQCNYGRCVHAAHPWCVHHSPKGFTKRVIKDDGGDLIWEVFCKNHASAVTEPLRPKPKSKAQHPIVIDEEEAAVVDDEKSNRRHSKAADGTSNRHKSDHSDRGPRLSMSHAFKVGPVSQTENVTPKTLVAAHNEYGDGDEDEADVEDEEDEGLAVGRSTRGGGKGTAGKGKGPKLAKASNDPYGIVKSRRTFPLLNLVEWPGQAEGEAMDLDHFWNLVGMSYAEDHPPEWIDFLTVPFLKPLDCDGDAIDGTNPILCMPCLGIGEDDAKASVELEASLAELGSDKDRIALLDFDKRQHLLSAAYAKASEIAGSAQAMRQRTLLASAVVSAGARQQTAGDSSMTTGTAERIAAEDKDQANVEDREGDEIEPAGESSREDTATAAVAESSSLSSSSTHAIAGLGLLEENDFFVKRVGRLAPALEIEEPDASGSVGLSVVFDGASRRACQFKVRFGAQENHRSCLDPLEDDDIQQWHSVSLNLEEPLSDKQRMIASHLIGPIFAVEDGHDDDDDDAKNGKTARNLSSAEVGLAGYETIDAAAPVYLSDCEIILPVEDDLIARMMRADQAAYTDTMRSVQDKINAILELGLREDPTKHAELRAQWAQVEATYLKQRIWKKVAGCAVRGIGDQRPDFNKPEAESLPASWTIRTEGRPAPPPPEEEEEKEEDAVCMVCFDGCSSEGNRILFCDGCNTPAHQACYGVTEIPDGDFYCDRCRAVQGMADDDPVGFTAVDAREAVKCCLCPQYHGAIKPTTDGRWVHLCCALWTEAAVITDLTDMGPVDVTAVPVQVNRGGGGGANPQASSSSTPAPSRGRLASRAARFAADGDDELDMDAAALERTLANLKIVEADIESSCIICNLKGGFLARCCGPAAAAASSHTVLCENVFHPLCAWFDGLYILSTLTDPTFQGKDRGGTYPSGLQFKFSCRDHSPAGCDTEIRQMQQQTLRNKYRMNELDLEFIPGRGHRRRRKKKPQKPPKENTDAAGGQKRVTGGANAVKDLKPDVYDGSCCAYCMVPFNSSAFVDEVPPVSVFEFSAIPMEVFTEAPTPLAAPIVIAAPSSGGSSDSALGPDLHTNDSSTAPNHEDQAQAVLAEPPADMTRVEDGNQGEVIMIMDTSGDFLDIDLGLSKDDEETALLFEQAPPAHDKLNSIEETSSQPDVRSVSGDQVEPSRTESEVGENQQKDSLASGALALLGGYGSDEDSAGASDEVQAVSQGAPSYVAMVVPASSAAMSPVTATSPAPVVPSSLVSAAASGAEFNSASVSASEEVPVTEVTAMETQDERGPETDGGSGDVENLDIPHLVTAAAETNDSMLIVEIKPEIDPNAQLQLRADEGFQPLMATSSSSNGVGGIYDKPSKETVTCARCQIVVHLSCHLGMFGVAPAPEMPTWLCDACQAEEADPRCVLCPRRAGGFKPTSDGKWAHVFCLRRSPLQYRIGYDGRVEIRLIPKENKRQKCLLCNRKQGVSLGCGEIGCTAYFHPLCGERSGKAYAVTRGGIAKIRCTEHIPEGAEKLPSGFWVDTQEVEDFRQKLDRARILLDIVNKREKAKRTLAKKSGEAFSSHIFRMLDRAKGRKTSTDEASGGAGGSDSEFESDDSGEFDGLDDDDVTGLTARRAEAARAKDLLVKEKGPDLIMPLKSGEEVAISASFVKWKRIKLPKIILAEAAGVKFSSLDAKNQEDKFMSLARARVNALLESTRPSTKVFQTQAEANAFAKTYPAEICQQLTLSTKDFLTHVGLAGVKPDFKRLKGHKKLPFACSDEDLNILFAERKIFLEEPPPPSMPQLPGRRKSTLAAPAVGGVAAGSVDTQNAAAAAAATPGTGLAEGEAKTKKRKKSGTHEPASSASPQVPPEPAAPILNRRRSATVAARYFGRTIHQISPIIIEIPDENHRLYRRASANVRVGVSVAKKQQQGLVAEINRREVATAATRQLIGKQKRSRTSDVDEPSEVSFWGTDDTGGEGEGKGVGYYAGEAADVSGKKPDPVKRGRRSAAAASVAVAAAMAAAGSSDEDNCRPFAPASAAVSAADIAQQGRHRKLKKQSLREDSSSDEDSDNIDNAFALLPSRDQKKVGRPKKDKGESVKRPSDGKPEGSPSRRPGRSKKDAKQEQDEGSSRAAVGVAVAAAVTVAAGLGTERVSKSKASARMSVEKFVAETADVKAKWSAILTGAGRRGSQGAQSSQIGGEAAAADGTLQEGGHDGGTATKGGNKRNSTKSKTAEVANSNEEEVIIVDDRTATAYTAAKGGKKSNSTKSKTAEVAHADGEEVVVVDDTKATADTASKDGKESNSTKNKNAEVAHADEEEAVVVVVDDTTGTTDTAAKGGKKRNSAKSKTAEVALADEEEAVVVDDTTTTTGTAVQGGKKTNSTKSKIAEVAHADEQEAVVVVDDTIAAAEVGSMPRGRKSAAAVAIGKPTASGRDDERAVAEATETAVRVPTRRSQSQSLGGAAKTSDVVNKPASAAAEAGTVEDSSSTHRAERGSKRARSVDATESTAEAAAPIPASSSSLKQLPNYERGSQDLPVPPYAKAADITAQLKCNRLFRSLEPLKGTTGGFGTLFAMIGLDEAANSGGRDPADWQLFECGQLHELERRIADILRAIEAHEVPEVSTAGKKKRRKNQKKRGGGGAKAPASSIKMRELAEDFLELPEGEEYDEWVRRRLALDVIQDRLKEHAYRCFAAFAKDFYEMLNNGIHATESNSQVSKDAKALAQLFEELKQADPGLQPRVGTVAAPAVAVKLIGDGVSGGSLDPAKGEGSQATPEASEAEGAATAAGTAKGAEAAKTPVSYAGCVRCFRQFELCGWPTEMKLRGVSDEPRIFDPETQFAWASALLAADPSQTQPRLPSDFQHRLKDGLQKRARREEKFAEEWESALKDAKDRGWLREEPPEARKRSPRSSRSSSSDEPALGTGHGGGLRAAKSQGWAWLCPECIDTGGGGLAGTKVRVWWWDDKTSYEGVVDAFDGPTGRHRVLYDDGEWEFISLSVEPVGFMMCGGQGRAPSSTASKPKANAVAAAVAAVVAADDEDEEVEKYAGSDDEPFKVGTRVTRSRHGSPRS